MSLLKFDYKELPCATITSDPEAKGYDYPVTLGPWNNAGLRGVHIRQGDDHVSITIEEAKALVEYLSIAIATSEEVK
ncbi:hypothetical protein [Yersinia phage MHG19]|nr:hypothetical protein [Yersinia phage MHG19]